MNIHVFEKIWLGVSLLLIVSFIGTIVYGSLVAGVSMVDDEGGTVDPSNIVGSENFREPGVYRSSDGTYDVYIIARQFAFSPGTGQAIRIPADTKVTLHITSGDVVHGFQVTGTNINTMVIPGQVSQMTVKFDEPGTYHIVCNEYCGAGHHVMEGTIEVVPKDQFNDATGGDSQ
ncbi:MAG: cytochrome c oxidase subunit II [Halobacteriaceae archaeon]